MVNTDALTLHPIAYVRSPYKQKFAIPRQSNLVPEAHGEIVFTPEFSDANALRGLEQFSHIWLIFVFHETADQAWHATVTPPRLGGTQRLGVFATRSMFRPNPLGLSVVEYLGMEQNGSQLLLKVRGLDLLDGTPIMDIKPYVPYVDALPEASGGFASNAPGQDFSITFSEQAAQQLQDLSPHYPELEQFICSVLRQDPRPAQHVRKQSARDFAMLLYDLNIIWHFDAGHCRVLSIEKTPLSHFPLHPAKQ